ncbi:MAG: TIGR02117 family protein [Candidatus Thiodiazotropha sp.]|jgi:uncharacterized protein (TIGR02117 family)
MNLKDSRFIIVGVKLNSLFPYANIAVGVLIILITTLTISGCSDNPKILNYMEKYTGHGHNEVYVVSHAWHTGFVIQSSKVYEVIPSLEKRFGNSANIEFGWGDRKFYQAKEITTGLAIRAIFWPTETVVHAVAVPENVRGYFANSQIELLCLNHNELSSLVKFISNSFSKNRWGEVELLAKGIYGDSQFYKGAGDYHMLNTCNEWTAKGLKSIGMDILPVTKVTAESVMTYLNEFNLTQNKAAVSETDSGCVFVTDK